MHQKTVQHFWVNIVKQQVTGGGCPTLKDTLIQPMEAALNQPTFLTQAQALLGKAISEHTTQQNAEVKSIINKDRQVAPKRMPLGARLAVNTHNMGGRFVESVCVCVALILLDRYWGIVTVPGSFLKAGDLGWPDPHPPP